MLLCRIAKELRWLCAGFLVAFAGVLSAQDEALEPNQPPPQPGETQVPLFPLPRTTGIGQYQVTIREPDDPEESQLGGSGGPILYVVVEGPEFSEPKATQVQTIWLYARDNGPKPPAFTLWSKTGVSHPVRCLLEWDPPNYCITECQDYEIGEQGMTPVESPRPQPPCLQ